MARKEVEKELAQHISSISTSTIVKEPHKVHGGTVNFVAMADVLGVDEEALKKGLLKYEKERDKLMSDLIDVIYGTDIEKKRIWSTIQMENGVPLEGAEHSQTCDTKPAVLRRQLSQPISDDLSCCQRMKLILSPVQKRETIADGKYAKTVIHISPEAFRMLFYIGFIIFTAIAIFTSVTWADIDYDDNIILDTYGANNICIFYDLPPFSHFGSTLWLPNVFLIAIYLVFDLFRVHDAFHEAQLGVCFYRCYCVVTVFEIFACCFFLQVTATDPLESMYWHTIPFVIVTFAQWTLAFKRLLWFIQTGAFRHYSPCLLYLAWIYVALMLIVIGGKTMVNVPNLFGAQLWTINGLEWTAPYSLINDRVYVFLTVICPPFIYFILAKEIETVVMTIDRESIHWDTNK